jgi:hypothetical protein
MIAGALTKGLARPAFRNVARASGWCLCCDAYVFLCIEVCRYVVPVLCAPGELVSRRVHASLNAKKTLLEDQLLRLSKAMTEDVTLHVARAQRVSWWRQLSRLQVKGSADVFLEGC